MRKSPAYSRHLENFLRLLLLLGLTVTYCGAQSLPHWDAALSAARQGTANARILCIGDSTTWGYEIGGPIPNSYPAQLATLAATGGNPSVSGLSIPNGTDSRWTIGAGWNSASLGAANTQALTNTGGGGALTFTATVLADSFYVYYIGGSGTGYTPVGAFTAQATGGSSVSVPFNSSLTGGIYRALVTAGSASSTNSVSITVASGNSAVIAAVEPFLSTKNQVLVGNAGVIGTATVNWNSNQPGGSFSFISGTTPDLVIISLGINDAGASVPVATYTSNMQAIISAAKATGADVILSTMPPAQGTPYTTYEPEYVTAIKSLAASNNLQLIDFYGILGGSFNAANMSDALHPNIGGTTLWAKSMLSTTFPTIPVQVTATQAILKYTAPTAAACTLQVSESPTLSPLVHDVDPSLFSGSNLDSRTGNTAVGLNRSFVVGTRRSDVAGDGNLYSRALQANTTHYYSLSCSGLVVTGQFTTVNPPLGNTFPEPMPFNSAGWGNYGWPTINWADKTVNYIDPLTGILIKRVTGPGEGVTSSVSGYNAAAPASPFNGNGGFNYFTDFNAAWTNASNVLSGSQSTYATYSGAASDPLFVAWDNNSMPEGFGWFDPGTNYGRTLDSVQLAAFGTGTDGSATNRTVEFCLSFYDSGRTCNTGYYTLTLPQTAPTPATTASGVYPASTIASSFAGAGGTAHTYTPFPDGGSWAGWGAVARRNDIAIMTGTYSSNGSTITNTSGYHAYFNLNWKAGGKIYLAGTTPNCPSNVCTIYSVTNGNTLVITQNLASLGNPTGAFHSLTSGILVKKTTGTGTINLSLSSAYAQSMAYVNPNGGDNQICSFTAVTVSYAADGVTPITPVAGYFCTFPISSNGNTSIHLLIPATGEVRFLTPNYVDNYANQTGSDQLRGNVLGWQTGMFDPSIGTKLYIPAPNSGIMTAQYTNSVSGCNFGSYAHSLYPGNGWGAGEDTTVYGFQGAMWTNSCMSYNSAPFLASNSTDLSSRIRANSKHWTPVMGTTAKISAIRGGNVFVNMGPTGQDTAAGLFILNLANGALALDSDSLAGAFPMRWNNPHSTNIGAPKGNMSVTSHSPMGNGKPTGNPAFNDFGEGPFVFTPTTMNYNGTMSSNTMIPASTQAGVATGQNNACPTGIATYLVQQGATGNNCITFQSQMACSVGPYWPSTGTTTLTAGATGTATTLNVASVTSPAITAGTYLYITTPTTTFPGFELVYVSGVSGTTLTVTRSVNGYPSAQNSGATVNVLSGTQSPEATAYPCDHGPLDVAGKPVWSEPSPIQVGDEFSLLPAVSNWPEYETWQIVSVTSLGNANYQFVASRFPTSDANGCVIPNGGFTPPTWQNGWQGYMYPICDFTAFADTSNLSAGWVYNYIGGGHTAFGYGGTSGYDTVVQSSDAADPYTVNFQVPLMSAANPFAYSPSWKISSSVAFAGYTPTYPWQSYPSMMQFAAPDPMMGRWMVDWHANNGSGGTNPDNGDMTGGNYTGVPVSGTSTVWAFTQSGVTIPYKYIQPTAYAGYHLLQDVSSPAMGNVVTDATPWTSCTAYVAGECRTGSTAGVTYISVPQAGGGRTGSTLGSCWNNWWDENAPCVINMQWHGASAVQGRVDTTDPNGQNWRKITTGFMGPGIEFPYTGMTVDPTGQWGLFDCNWCNGYRSDMFMAKLPPFPSEQPTTNVGTAFIPVTVSLDPSAQFDQARVRFGYVENGGSPSNFYCTPRADACMTSSTITPFAFISEGAAWASCASGCNINVPAVPGRVLYYVVDRKNSTSGQTSMSEMRTSVNP